MPEPDRQSFVSQLLPIALRYQAITHIPAQVLLAIAAHESNFGNAGNNMLFGIKGPGATYATHEIVGGKRVDMPDSFRTYASPEASFQDFIDLVSQGRYANAWNHLQQTGDWHGFLHGINAAGYATDPDWSNKISNFASNTIEPLAQVAYQAIQPTTAYAQEADESPGSTASALSAADGSITIPGLGPDTEDTGEWRSAEGGLDSTSVPLTVPASANKSQQVESMETGWRLPDGTWSKEQPSTKAYGTLDPRRVFGNPDVPVAGAIQQRRISYTDGSVQTETMGSNGQFNPDGPRVVVDKDKWRAYQAKLGHDIVSERRVPSPPEKWQTITGPDGSPIAKVDPKTGARIDIPRVPNLRPTVVGTNVNDQYITTIGPDGKLHQEPNPSYDPAKAQAYENRANTQADYQRALAGEIPSRIALQQAQAAKYLHDIQPATQLALQNHYQTIAQLQQMVASGQMTTQDADRYAQASQQYAEAALRGATPFEEMKERQQQQTQRAQIGAGILNQRLSSGSALANSLMSGAANLATQVLPSVAGKIEYNPATLALAMTNELGGGQQMSPFAQALVKGAPPIGGPAGMPPPPTGPVQGNSFDPSRIGLQQPNPLVAALYGAPPTLANLPPPGAPPPQGIVPPPLPQFAGMPG